MPNRFPIAATIAALAVLFASIAGLVAMSGLLPQAPFSPLSAEVRVAPVLLPGDVALDPLEISEHLEAALSQRAERDVAVRMAFGPESSERLMTIVIPRLVNSAVISRMIEQIPPLRTVVSLGRLRSAVQVEVRNMGQAVLEDVAMTMPGLSTAETPEGAALDAVATEGGPPAVRLGSLDPGQRRRFTAWLTLPADSPQIQAELSLGAAGGLDGLVLVHPADDWLGEDLGLYGWARWIVGGVLAAAALGAVGVLVVLASGMLPSRGRGAIRPA